MVIEIAEKIYGTSTYKKPDLQQDLNYGALGHTLGHIVWGTVGTGLKSHLDHTHGHVQYCDIWFS